MDVDLPTVPADSSLTFEYDRTFDGSAVSTVVVELPDETTLRLRIADHFAAICELENVDRRLTLLAYPAGGVRHAEDEPLGIDRPDTWYTQWSAELYGEVEAVDAEPLRGADTRFAVLDVGIGSVFVHSSLRESLPSGSSLETGQKLCVPASVVEIREVTP